MENSKRQLEEAIANSTATDYEKGNLLYLAEAYADSKAKTAIDTIAEYETSK